MEIKVSGIRVCDSRSDLEWTLGGELIFEDLDAYDEFKAYIEEAFTLTHGYEVDPHVVSEEEYKRHENEITQLLNKCDGR